MRADLERNMRAAGFDPSSPEEVRVYKLWCARQRKKKFRNAFGNAFQGKPNEINEYGTRSTLTLSYLPVSNSFSPEVRKEERGECAREGGELVLFPGMAETRRFEDGRVSVVPAKSFAQFCAVYPHIPNIEDAEWAFEAALERATFQEIMEGAQRYANWLDASGSYPTAAHNWLAKGCWAAKLAIAKPRVQDLAKLEDAYVRYEPVQARIERHRRGGGSNLDRLLAQCKGE